jgi:hypothetical protein
MTLSLPNFADSPLTSARKSTALFLVILLFAVNVCALGQNGNGGAQVTGATTPGAVNTTTVQPTPTPPPSPTLTIDPSQAARGGDPFKVTLKFAEGVCKGNVKFKDKDHVLANKDELAKKGITLDILEVPDDGCTLTANLIIGGDAPNGQQTLTFNLQDATTKTASVTFTVTKEEPLPPGPIPPGMRPQVDIMWAVVPQRIVKDNFGTRVGKLFYCVEVVIGNNTGYDLQIAAVAFKLGPVDEAAAAAFDMFKDAKEQINAISQSRIRTIRARNQAAEDAALAATLEAQAKILEIRAKQDKSSEAVARAVEARKKADEQNEIAKVTKAAAEVMQAAADEVTRNGQDVVKNNGEDIRNLTALSRQAYGQSLPVSSFRMARGSVEHGQFWSARGLTINTLKAFGPFLTGFTPYFRNINHQKNYSEAINIISNPLEKGFEAVIPYPGRDRRADAAPR